MMLCSALALTIAAAPTIVNLERTMVSRDEANDVEWRVVQDRLSLNKKCTALRQRFRRAAGFSRIARTPLQTMSFGVKDYGPFRVEKAVVESAPGAFIPLLVFLPDTRKHTPPYAGFVFIPGHAMEGKAYSNYLHTCELGARNGLAAVIYDPLGQGERSQGAGLRNADEHVRIGAYAALLGETTATYMLRDAVRVLDYLESRSDVDSARLGVCGNSGGGTMSAFLMVADDRIKAAAPSCYLSSAREHIVACGPQDSEQNFFDEFSWGFNHAAMVLSAGCPVLINAAVEDFFQIEGSRSTYRIVKEVAAKVGLPDDWYEISEAPGKHAMSKVHREQAVRFLLKHLKGEVRDVVETGTCCYKAEDCTVTPGGEVSRLAGFRSVYDDIADKFVVRGVSEEQAATNAVPLVLKELNGEDCRGVLTFLKGDVKKGRRSVLRIGGPASAGESTATFFAEGSRYVKATERTGKRSYYECRGDDEVVAVELYIAGRSLVALRAAELLTLAAELKRRTGLTPELVAEGRFSTVAKFAVAADAEAFASVKYENTPKTFLESLRARDYLSFADSGAICSARPDGLYVTNEGDCWQMDWSWRENGHVTTAIDNPKIIAWDSDGKVIFEREVGRRQQRCYDPGDSAVAKWRVYAKVGTKVDENATGFGAVAAVVLPERTKRFSLLVAHHGDESGISDLACEAVRIKSIPSRPLHSYPQIDAEGCRVLSDADLDAVLEAAPRLHPVLRRNGDRVDLLVNGKTVVPRIYKGANRNNANRMPAIGIHSQDGFNVFTICFRLDDAPGAAEQESAGIWRADGSCDLNKVRSQLREALRRNPDAMLMVCLVVSPHTGWGEKNPSELFRNEKGQFGVFTGCRVTAFRDRPTFDVSKDEYPAVSYASEKFAKDASSFLERLLAGIEEMPEGKKVIGTYVCGGTDTQWLDLFNNRVRVEQAADYSDVMKRRFAAFRRARYGTDSIDVEIPPAAAFWDAGRQFYSEHGPTAMSDYREFVARTATELRLSFAKAIKRGSGGRILVGSYSPAGGMEGYPLISASFTSGLLDSPDFDFFAVVPNYMREHVDPVMAAIYDGACIAKGKLYVSEMDLRTSEVAHWGIWGSEFWRENHTAGTFMRKTLYFAANALTHGGVFHAYDLNGGWFATGGARKAWRRANELAGLAKAMPLSRDRIALVGGERFFDFQSLKKERCLPYFIREQPRAALARCGIPWNQYLLDDFLRMEESDIPKVVIFTDLSTITYRQYERLKSLCLKNGRVVVWMWRPGVFSASGEQIERNLGIVPCVAAYGLRGYADGNCDDALMRGVSGTIMPSYPAYNYANVPLFAPTPESGWSALASFEGTDLPALSVRRADGRTEIYTSVPGGITPQLCRNMAREAGFQPVVDSDDISGFGSGILYILAQSDGVKTIRLPHGTRPDKVFCGQDFQVKDDCLEVHLKRGDLWIMTARQ